ncbi:unnamed protein product, partial [Candidula unifasciata]
VDGIGVGGGGDENFIVQQNHVEDISCTFFPDNRTPAPELIFCCVVQRGNF